MVARYNKPASARGRAPKTHSGTEGPRPPRCTLGDIADSKGHRSQLISPARSSRTPGRINLRAVAEVLADRGMDPTEEIIKLLRPGVDEKGVEIPSKLDPDTRARVQLELLQYVQPKLKSVEIKAKVAATSFDVNDEQARRIAEEFLKASAPGGELDDELLDEDEDDPILD